MLRESKEMMKQVARAESSYRDCFGSFPPIQVGLTKTREEYLQLIETSIKNHQIILMPEDIEGTERELQ